MMQLAQEKVVDGAPRIAAGQLDAALAGLEGWRLADDGRAIERRIEVKTFARAQILANLAGGIAELANHHPEISYGWGFCVIRFTTHSAGGVSRNDLICAARINDLLNPGAGA